HRHGSKTNLIERISQGVCGRGAVCRDNVAGTTKTKAHGDFAGERAHGAGGNAKETGLFFVAGMPKSVLLFGKFLRTTAGAENNTNAALLVWSHSWRIEAGVSQSLRGSSDRKRNRARNVLAFTGVDPGEFVEVLNLAGDVNRQER